MDFTAITTPCVEPFLLSEASRSSAAPPPSFLVRRQLLRQLCNIAALGSAPAIGGSLLAHATAAVAQTASPLSAASSNSVRLVTVGGALTEMVYALKLEHLLVGTDTTSLYPAAAQHTAKVGYMRQLSAEGVLSLKPTALVATTEAGPPVVLDQLRSAGVRIEHIKADHTWDEVRRKLEALGRVLGRTEAATALWHTLDAEWTRTQQRVAQHTQARAAAGHKPPRFLFLLAHSGTPQASGEGTAADALIRFIGGRNAMSGAYGFKGYKPLTPESMAAAAPEIILTTTQGLEAVGGESALWQRPELRLTPAYAQRQQGRLWHKDALELLGFGPRMPALVAALAQQVSALSVGAA